MRGVPVGAVARRETAAGRGREAGTREQRRSDCDGAGPAGSAAGVVKAAMDGEHRGAAMVVAQWQANSGQGAGA